MVLQAMGLDTATLILLLTLTPGVVMAVGMRQFSRFNFKAGDPDKITQTILLAIASFVLQIFFILPLYLFLLNHVCSYLYKENFFDLYKSHPFFDDKGKINFLDLLQNYKLIVMTAGYIPAACFISFIAGWIAILAIEDGRLPIPFFHGGMYSLIKGEASPGLACSVCTKIQHENSFLMYRGTIADISYITKNKIEYLFLKNVYRYLIQIDARGFTKTTKMTPVTYFGSHGTNQKIKDELFYINGEDISNILFSRLPIPGKKSIFFAVIKWAIYIAYLLFSLTLFIHPDTTMTGYGMLVMGIIAISFLEYID